MPKIRGLETGSKKRYAGLVATNQGEELLIRGLEAVRSDWTALARQFQRQVFERILKGLEFEDYIKQTVGDVLSGRCDRLLVYRKRLRRPLQKYEAISPPHVQAARILSESGVDVRKGDWVEYVITRQGAQPVALADHAILDYDHYLEKQLAPVVNGLLETVGTDFKTITNRQYVLF